MRSTLWLPHATREVDVSLTFDPAAERMVRTQLRTRGIRDPAVLEPRKPMQRDAVERLHTLFLGIHQRAVEQGTASPTLSKPQTAAAVASGLP